MTDAERIETLEVELERTNERVHALASLLVNSHLSGVIRAALDGAERISGGPVPPSARPMVNKIVRHRAAQDFAWCISKLTPYFDGAGLDLLTRLDAAAAEWGERDEETPGPRLVWSAETNPAPEPESCEADEPPDGGSP